MTRAGTGILEHAVAVVGSGPGGSITAALLAEAGHDVLLIESGAHVPQDAVRPFSVSQMERQYANGGISAALGRCPVQYVEGACAGGGSEVNSGLYHRLPEDVRADWERRRAVRGLSAAALDEHYEALERELCVSTMPPGTVPPASLAMEAGARELGWRCQEVPRWHAYGPGLPEGGRRQTMTETFLPRLMAAGGRLLCDTRALALRRSGGRWLLRAERRHPDGAVQRLDVLACTVFLACGAVRTPALLQRSGLRLGAAAGLCLHPTVKVTALFDREVNGPGAGVPVHQVKEFSPRIGLGCSVNAPWYLAAGLADVDGGPELVRERWRTMASYYAMAAPGASGSVRALPGLADPLVRYPVDRTTREDLAEGLGALCRLLFRAGARRVYPTVRGLGPLRDEADLRRIPAALPARGTGLMTIHLMGSLPLGEDGSCPVDSFGRVRGQENLYVADASLLGGAPGVNPQGTLMALVRRNALAWLDGATGRNP